MDDLCDTVDTYEAVADRYRQRHADRSVVADQVERFLSVLAEAGHGRGARILDAGCGPGWEAATFAERGHHPVGIDLSESFLGMASEETDGADLARMDMRQQGIRTGTVDGVWACASLVHLPRETVPDALAEFRRILGAEGVLHATVKRGEGRVGGTSYEGDRREFTLFGRDEFRALLAEADFSVRTLETSPDWIAATAVLGGEQ